MRRSRRNVASATTTSPTSTVTLCGVAPPRSDGTANSKDISPPGVTVAVPRGQLTGANPEPVTRFPSIVHHSRLATAPAGSPVPDTVTEVPTGPCAGVTVRLGSARTAGGNGMTSAATARRTRRPPKDFMPDPLRLLNLGRLRPLPAHAGQGESDAKAHHEEEDGHEAG